MTNPCFSASPVPKRKRTQMCSFFVKQFSSFCIKRGCKIINITDDEQMIDVNCGKMIENPNQFRLMAYIEGTAEHIKYDLNGNTYNDIKVGDKIYIPEK